VRCVLAQVRTAIDAGAMTPTKHRGNGAATSYQLAAAYEPARHPWAAASLELYRRPIWFWGVVRATPAMFAEQEARQ
jgi:hypothetical protein